MSKTDEVQPLLIEAAKAVMEKEMDPFKKAYMLSILKGIDEHRKALDRLYNEIFAILGIDMSEEEVADGNEES